MRIALALGILGLTLAGCGKQPPGRSDHYSFYFTAATPRAFSGPGSDDASLVTPIEENFATNYDFGQEAQYSETDGTFETFDVQPEKLVIHYPIHPLSAERSGSTQGGTLTLAGDVATIQIKRDVLSVEGDPPQLEVLKHTYTGQVSAAALRQAAVDLSLLPDDSSLPGKIEISWLLSGQWLDGRELAVSFKQDLTPHSIVLATGILAGGR